MSKKELICYLNAETEYSNAVLEAASNYEQAGADALYIYNYDDDEKATADFLETMKLLIKRVDLPIYVGTPVHKFDDYKHMLYTGAEYCVVQYSKNLDLELLEYTIKRFGNDKVVVQLNADENAPEQDAYNSEITKKLADLGVAKFIFKHVTVDAASQKSIAECPLPVIIRDSLVRNDIVSLMKLENVSGAATNFYRGKDILNIKRSLKENGLDVFTLESSIPFSDFKKNSDGLVPCVVQDYKTNEVLMVAYMNEEAYNNTIKTGRMTYFSRSRNELWVKGETSGHYQFVKKILIDCDNDTLLAKVKQLGAACHTGNYSCFFTELAKKEYNDIDPMSVLVEDYNIILDRKVNPREGSYTNYLFTAGIDKILKKCGEEASEIIIAAKNPDREEVKYEIADFLYHVMVLMAECDVDWNDITRELANRRK
ncbi:MAG: bifunctional phosphoribosyl-AMP cyclohydrolase/phosphoribosyl-ATP diphosphatase HisIE [Lachnospiraceae bacterium]|nr:bifunctional phosphoribosyl-AMP cyclohydrolase/phosphoribosyl-ATP diphosphatase HisIE [Lachnospiraceae bacterium]